MKQYILLGIGKPEIWNKKNGAEWDKAMDHFGKWIAGMEAKNQFIRGDRLSVNRREISGSPGKVNVLDGPYVETKEALSGFILFRAADMNEATEIAKGCPRLFHDKMELIELEHA